MQEYYCRQLSNGIRTIHKEISYTKIAHVGIMLDIGSRDEDSSQKGIPIFGNICLSKEPTKENHFILSID